MSGTNWTDGAGTGDWYGNNWSGGAPASTAEGTLKVTISGSIGTQPTISPTEGGATDVINVTQSGTSYEDAQIGGQTITLTNKADLTIQGAALGTYLDDHVIGSNITNLTAAPNATPTFDTYMVITAAGTDAVTFNDVNHNFGLLEAAGAGNDLNITIGVGGNVQTAHALYNYGEILATAGATVAIDVLNPNTNGDTTNFGNAGWIMVTGGTFETNTEISDGANVQNGAGTPDGYIEIGSVGSAILLGSVAAKEEILFLDANHNLLEIANGNSFQGSVVGFQSGDTIEIAGVTQPVSLSYAGSILSVGEYNSAGTLTATTTIDIGTSYTATEFVGLLSTGGVDVVTSTQAAATGFTLHATGTNAPLANFEDPTQYTGGIAPGSTIVAGETVTVVPTSLADITTSLTNNGLILLNGYDANLEAGTAVTGAGTIALTGGAVLNLTNTSGVTTNTIAFGADATTNPNILELSGTSAGFGGAITGFGASDEIVLGASILPAGTTANMYSNSYNAGTGVLTVTEKTAAGAVVGTETLSIASTGSLNSSSFAELNGPGGTTIILGTAVSSTLTDAIFSPEAAASGTVVGGETISGSLNSVYNSTGTLISETGTMILTETLTSGSIVTETFAINGVGTVGAGNAGINGNDDSNGQYEVFLSLVSSTGTGPIFTDLHLDWNSETNQDFYLGVENNYYSALVSPSLTTETLLSVGAMTTSGSIFIDHGQSVPLSNLTSVDPTPAVFGTDNSSISINTLDINATVAGTNSPYTGAISGFGLNDDIVLGPLVLPSVAAGGQVSLAYAGSLLSVTEFNSSGASIGSTTLDIGAGYGANAFVALIGTNGVNIETPLTVIEKPLTYSGTGLGSFENPLNYTGGLAPGGSIVAGEVVSVVSGTASIAASSPVSNSGTIILSGSSTALIDSSSLSGFGTVVVGGGAALTLANTVGATTNTIIFGGTGNNVLALDGTGTASFNGTIANIGGTDTIDLGASFLPTPTAANNIGLSFNTGTGLLTVTDTVGGTTYTDTLHISGTVPGSFHATLGPNGIVITDIPCFAAGTRILTPDGQVAVEHLAVGDSVLTVLDGAAQKIIWRGQRTIDLRRHANPEKVMPVRILAGAFAAGTPERDLVLSPDHALLIDGHLIEAKTLVNGVTIIRDRAAFVTYHHIELERHDAVLAEGLAAETYLDSGNRQNFDSVSGVTVLHPEFAASCRDKACAKLLLDGDIVRQTRQTLLARAGALGFVQTGAVDLQVKAALEMLAPQAGGSADEWLFVLPPAASHAELISSTGVPAEVQADPSDRRRLGVAVTGLSLIANGTCIDIALDDDRHAGFHAVEGGQRWTGGHARIALPAYTGRAVLAVTLNGQAARWSNGKNNRESSRLA
jgi:hypothetical protein